MPSSLKLSLQIILQGLLNAFRPSSTSQEEKPSMSDSELLALQLPPRREIDVTYYKELLRIQIANAETSRSVLEGYQVVRITHYRNHHFLALQREFLIAQVRLPGEFIYIRIHRSFEHDSLIATQRKVPENANEDQNLVLKALNEDLKSMSCSRNERANSLRHKFALPLAKRSGHLNFRMAFIGSGSLAEVVEDSPFATSKDDICLLDASQLNLSESWEKADVVEPKCLFLYQLATVAFVVQKRDFLYAPLANQSFWYAAMIMAAIRQMDKEASPPNVVPTQASPVFAPLNPGARGVEVYVSHKSFPRRLKDASPSDTHTELPSRSDDNANHGRKVVKMPLTHAYPVMLELLCSSIQAEIQTLSEMIRSVDQQKAASRQRINDEVARAIAETARLKERINRADEETLALIRKIEKSKRAGEHAQGILS